MRYGQALIFPMDARGTLAGVGQTYSADEVPDFAGNRGTAAITPALPTPVQSESLSVPGNDRCRFDDEERRPPFIP